MTNSDNNVSRFAVVVEVFFLIHSSSPTFLSFLPPFLFFFFFFYLLVSRTTKKNKERKVFCRKTAPNHRQTGHMCIRMCAVNPLYQGHQRPSVVSMFFSNIDMLIDLSRGAVSVFLSTSRA